MKRRQFIPYLWLLLSTVVIFGLYLVLTLAMESLVFFFVYYGVMTALLLYYVIYNRGFSRHSLTLENMPPHLSVEEKQAVLAERDLRKARSKWAIYILFPGILTLLYDCVTLFILPNLQGLFGGGA
ncbi:MAG: hypothetical protein IJW71_03325 [Clostridia bacterium]|nr:hypothetical protein [Clostridia bacterium]